MTAWSELIDGIAERLAGDPEASGFLPLLGTLRTGTSSHSGGHVPQKLPVQRFWPAAGASDPLGPLMAALGDALAVAWQQNPNYRTQPPSPNFLENYGYLECAGPGGPLTFPDLRLGLLLLGPDTFYPPHCHPAEEVYLPLGAGRWLREGDGWRDVPAGAVIYHPSMCRHATQSGAEALAAIYLWRGEIGPAARID